MTLSHNICGLTAFRLHRVPPPVLSFFPYFPDISYPLGKLELLDYPLELLNVPLPVHTLVSSREQLRYRRSVAAQLWGGDMPPGMFCENELGITLTSPLYTLFTMTQKLSETHLLMAMYEFCGTFSVFRPSKEIQKQLNQARKSGELSPYASWQQVYDADGDPTSLWKRPPLIEIAELQRFADQTAGMRGHKKFARAASHVTGITASPFEAQASILFGLSRRLGGEELPPFTNNECIRLTPQAHTLANQKTCYADIYFAPTETHGALDIECHGHMVHDGGTKGGLDANRTLGLQSMGIEVMLLTHEQLVNAENFAAAMDHIAARLSIQRRPKTEAMQKRAEELRRNLFIDWETLGA